MSVPQQKLKIHKSKSNKSNNFTHQKFNEKKGHQIKLQYFEFHFSTRNELLIYLGLFK